MAQLRKFKRTIAIYSKQEVVGDNEDASKLYLRNWSLYNNINLILIQLLTQYILDPVLLNQVQFFLLK